MAAPLTIARNPDPNHPRRVRIGCDDGTVVELCGDGTVHRLDDGPHLLTRTGELVDAALTPPADDAHIVAAHSTVTARNDHTAWMWHTSEQRWQLIADDVAALTDTARHIYVAHHDGRVTTRDHINPWIVWADTRVDVPLVELAPIGSGWVGIDKTGGLRTHRRPDTVDATGIVEIAPHLPTRLKEPTADALDDTGTLHHIGPSGDAFLAPIVCADWGLHHPHLIATDGGTTWLRDDSGHLWVSGWYGFAHTGGLADVGRPGTDHHTLIWQLANTDQTSADIDLVAVADTGRRLA